MAAPEVQVERLTLHLGGIGGVAGRQVAELVGEGLAAALAGPDSSLARPGRHEVLRVAATTEPGATPAALSRAVVSALLIELGRLG
jgi:hypothetical protein